MADEVMEHRRRPLGGGPGRAWRLEGALGVALLLLGGLFGPAWPNELSQPAWDFVQVKEDARLSGGELRGLVTAAWVHLSPVHRWTNLVLMAGLTMMLWSALPGRGAGRLLWWGAVCLGASVAGFGLSWAAGAGASAGASGIVYGLLGLMLGLRLRLWGEPETRPWLVALAAVVVGLWCLPMATPGIDHAAHAGGLVFGVGAGWKGGGRRLVVLVGVAVTPLILLSA